AVRREDCAGAAPRTRLDRRRRELERHHAMSGEEPGARRVCPGCAARERLRAEEAVWPVGWRCPACGYVIAQSGDIALLAPELADTVSGFDPGSFAAIAEIEADNFWFVARRELIVGLLARYFPNARSLIEIGCGTGAVLQALRGARRWRRLAGSELHPTGLAQARARMAGGVEFG